MIKIEKEFHKSHQSARQKVLRYFLAEMKKLPIPKRKHELYELEGWMDFQKPRPIRK